MEGAGSRQSRASSRYASSPSAPPFNGPVRKWKKQWVTSQSSGLNSGNNRNNAPPLLLCRWTPLSATASADEPPRRRFRYAPVNENKFLNLFFWCLLLARKPFFRLPSFNFLFVLFWHFTFKICKYEPVIVNLGDWYIKYKRFKNHDNMQ